LGDGKALHHLRTARQACVTTCPAP
jgi:hypothetical protein